jgi:uncharacterized protein YegL
MPIMFSSILNTVLTNKSHTQGADMREAAKEDLIMNPTPRCACMLVLDTSGSMDGAPIQALNEGVQTFISELQQDELAQYSLEVGIVTAGGSITQALPITPVRLLDTVPRFSATGTTPLGGAVNQALTILEARKAEYKRNGVPYYQPWIVIISDGSPTDSWQMAASQSKLLAEQRKLVVIPVGVDGADLGILSQFSNRGAKTLSGIKFKEFFQWLSASMSRVSASSSTSDSVTLPATSGWDSI